MRDGRRALMHVSLRDAADSDHRIEPLPAETQEDAPTAEQPAPTPDSPVRRGRATFDAADPRASFQFGARDLWRILITWNGIPAAYRELADPGRTASGPL